MNDLHERHMEFIDAVNNARTLDEHTKNMALLYGWRQGAHDAGGIVDLVGADLEQIARGHGERPMNYGVFLDWKPERE